MKTQDLSTRRVKTEEAVVKLPTRRKYRTGESETS